MDVRIPAAPTFAPNHLPPPVPVFPSPLAEKVEALEKRIEELEASTVAIKALEATILLEKVATLLKVGPKDTVIFTVPEDIDIDLIPLSVHKSIKEKLGVAHVFFVTHGMEISVIAPKE